MINHVELGVNTGTVLGYMDSINGYMGKIKSGLADTSIDLDSRWYFYDLLVKAGVLREIEAYGDGFLDTLNKNMTLYDDLSYERHETVKYLEMYERIQDNFGDENAWNEPWKSVTQETVDAWREQVLASGEAGFTYDW